MKAKLLFLGFLATISLSVKAQTQLWGTCRFGGAYNWGTIFNADADGSNLHSVYDFDSISGAQPNGNLVLANNGKLYGVTRFGGYDDSCVVFSYDPHSGICTDIWDLFQ